jgi:hypothetical protein
MAPARPLVLTVAEAARQLGVRRTTARALLQAAGLVHGVGDTERVITDDLLDAIRHGRLTGAGQAPPPAAPPSARRGTLRAVSTKRAR